MYGLEYDLPTKLRAKVKKKIPSTSGLKEFVRVNLTEIEEELIAAPQKRGSASMNSLINADGIMPIKESKETKPNIILHLQCFINELNKEPDT